MCYVSLCLLCASVFLHFALYFFFFFSSRRRHTRLVSDWSSDVCSSDLESDPERIALMGDSSGGHLAALVALAGEHALFREGNAADPHGRISTAVKACVPIYAVLDLARQWRHDQISRPRDQIVEKFLGASPIDDRRIYFDASPLSHVSSKNNGTAFLLAWGTEDDVVDHKEQSEAFLEALKQAGHYVRSVVVAGAPHFWIGDPLDEAGSHSAVFAHRLLGVMQARPLWACTLCLSCSSRGWCRSISSTKSAPTAKGGSGKWTSRRRATARPRTCRASCSSSPRGSAWCTCPTRAGRRA